MTPQASRLLRAVEFYMKNNPNRFDSRVVLNKFKDFTSSDGVTRGSFLVDKSLCNGANTLHGGFITASTDTLATFAHLGNTGKIAWTMNLDINFISTAQLGQEVIVEITPIRQGVSPVMETRFIKLDGGLVAKGTTSLMNGNGKFQKIVKEIYDVDPEA